jgi:hypothetical protein
MTETPGEELDERAGPPAEPEGGEEASPPSDASPAASSSRSALWLGALLVLVIAGVALSPFWAPELAPLLPWGEGPAVSPADLSGLAARVDALEKRPAPAIPDIGPIAAAQSALAKRVDQLETVRSAQQQTEAAVAAAKTAVQQLDQRVAAIEAQPAARAGEEAEMQKLQQEVARLGTVSGDLTSRLAALEAQSASRTAAENGEIQNFQQEVSKVGGVATDLTNRLAAIEHQLATQGGVARTEAALLVSLLQMREALDQGRPFPTEYAAFTALAHDQADLISAAEPLAPAAKTGVPSRLVLSTKLAELAGRITSAPPPRAGDWGAQALARLRSLVTIRRLDSTSESGPTAVDAAERALAQGDLGEAVAELDRLSGADAEAAAQWLGMARQRLAAEAALSRVQELLTDRLTRPAESAANPRTPP